MSTTATVGELKRDIVDAVGCDPSRYSADLGHERHKVLTKQEVVAIASAVGLAFLADESKQQLKDSIMLKLGRDHRTGVRYFDSSDLRAIHDEVVA